MEALDMAKANLTLVVPRAESREPGPTPVKSHWNGDLRGKVIALIDTGRPNGDVTVASIAEHLWEEYRARIITISNRVLGGVEPAEGEHMVEKIPPEADVVI